MIVDRICIMLLPFIVCVTKASNGNETWLRSHNKENI